MTTQFFMVLFTMAPLRGLRLTLDSSLGSYFGSLQCLFTIAPRWRWGIFTRGISEIFGGSLHNGYVMESRGRIRRLI